MTALQKRGGGRRTEREVRGVARLFMDVYDATQGWLRMTSGRCYYWNASTATEGCWTSILNVSPPAVPPLSTGASSRGGTTRCRSRSTRDSSYRRRASPRLPCAAL